MKADAIKPIFLVSLPRSGSTLVQRVLAAHPAIATASEPWVLLPLYSALDKSMARSRYGHIWLSQATADLCRVLPNGIEDYHAAVNVFASELYRKIAAGNAEAMYFLDKTPRYHLIIQYILEAFPDGKFILLWRNPLATLASRIKSYGNVWRMQNYQVDLYDGLRNLVEVYNENAERFEVVRYEDVLTDPDRSFGAIFEYLGLEYDPDVTRRFADVMLSGDMGDKSGLKDYKTLAREPLEKWVNVLASPVRKAWCKRYISWLGRGRLEIMGYDQDELIHQLNSVPNRWRDVPEDIGRLVYGTVKYRLTKGML